MTSIINELGLTAEDILCLKRQGFVSREYPCGRLRFKLRFRGPSGKQRVRYLGSDSVDAKRVEQELAELQTGRRLERELCKLKQQAGEKLRASKDKLAPQLNQAGLHFHGMSIRRKRAGK